MRVPVALRVHPAPVRRAAFFLAAAALAHAVLAGVAFAAWRGRAGGVTDAAVLAPVVVADAFASLLPVVGVGAAVLAVVALRAAAGVVLLRRGAGRAARGAAWASLLNPPVGALFGLLALGHLDRPRTRAFLRAVEWREDAV